MCVGGGEGKGVRTLAVSSAGNKLSGFHRLPTLKRYNVSEKTFSVNLLLLIFLKKLQSYSG